MRAKRSDPRKTETIQVRVTAEQKSKLQRLADRKANGCLTDYLLQQALPEPAPRKPAPVKSPQ